MKGLIQLGCVIAIALGAGLFAFGSYFEPRIELNDPAAVASFIQHQGKDEHIAASLARGFGIGFITLGGLGLVVPWVNALLVRQQPPNRSTPPDVGLTV
jgi:hypothetical protein